MKREDIEKAAAIYTAQADDFDYAEVRDVKQAFVNGAEWMKKHFSWISVEERLPESKEKVLVLNRMKHHDKYFVSENIYINGNWAAKSAMYYEEIAWMPIPSFDEILEANRDVLERIKYKSKPTCIRDKDKTCSKCHECDVDVMNPTRSNY
jgi:hypothetical protein